MCDSIRPDYEGFKKQGSSLIAVMERCKANYQQKQWDSGAFMAYDAKAMGKIAASSPLADNDGVGKCLLKAHESRESNMACMQDFLSRTYQESSNAAVFWSYAKIPSSDVSSDNVDACIVFSGPAKKQDGSLTTQAFQNCSHDYTGSICMIQHMVRSVLCDKYVHVSVSCF